MQLAILFWFYKEPDVCKNRLELLKVSNPEAKIYGLYGGNPKEAQKYKKGLAKYLDDFYQTSHKDKPKNWKWINGDLLILDWYEKRGKKLAWDSIVVVQWDMLVFDSFKKQFQGIKKGEVFLSGLKTLDKVTESKWYWTSNIRYPEERKRFLKFQNYVQDKYGYKGKLLCCLFILEVFPVEFFQDWSKLEDKELGMLEYKIPTYAKIFNLPFFKKDLGVEWFSKKDLDKMPLNAKRTMIDEKFINKELAKRNGFRIFHPYEKIWNLAKGG